MDLNKNKFVGQMMMVGRFFSLDPQMKHWMIQFH